MQLAHALKKTLMLIIFSVLLNGITMSAVAASEVTVITYGDSITAGLKRTASGVLTCPQGVDVEPGRYGDPRDVCYGNGALNVGGYQTDLVDAISAAGFTPKISNYGYSGISTSIMSSRRGSVLSLPGAQYVLILGGANDAVDNVSRRTVLANLTTIVNDVKNRGMIPVITTVTRNTSNGAVYDVITGRYAEDLRAYAASNNVLLADARAAMTANWSSFHSGDGLHLGPLGDQTLADLYFQEMGLVGVGSDASINSISASLYLLLLSD